MADTQYAAPSMDEAPAPTRGPAPRNPAPVVAQYDYHAVANSLEPRIEDHLIDFAELTEHIAKLEAETSQLPGAQAQLGPLQARQAQLQAALNGEEATIAKGEEILSGFHPFKNKKEWTEKVEAAKAQKAEIEASLVPVVADVGKAQNTVNSLIAQSHDLEAARRGYARLLSEMFDGATPGYPEEQRLEDVASAEYARWVQIATDLPALQQANGHLRKAAAMLSESLQRLQGAMGANTGAVIMAAGRGRRGGGMMAVIQQQQIRASGEMAQQANTEILKARQIMPSIPNLNQIHIDQQQGLFLFQIMGRGAIMDVVARQKIRESMGYLIQQKQILDGVVAWVTSALAQKQGAIDVYRKNLDAARARLLGKRVAIAEGLVQIKFNQTLPQVAMMLQPPMLPIAQHVNASPAPAMVTSGGQVMSIQPGMTPYGVPQNQVFVQQPATSSRYDMW